MERISNLIVSMQREGKRFVKEEEGVGVVEIVLILVILVGLVLIFKDQIGDVVNSALENFSDDASKIVD